MSGADKIMFGGGIRFGKRLFSLMRYIESVESGERAIYIGKKFCVISTDEFKNLKRAADKTEQNGHNAQQPQVDNAGK